MSWRTFVNLALSSCTFCGQESCNGAGCDARRVFIDRHKESGAVPSMDSFDPSTVTLRDQFAMAALTGLFGCGRETMTEENIAKDVYRMADAMMTERKPK